MTYFDRVIERAEQKRQARDASRNAYKREQHKARKAEAKKQRRAKARGRRLDLPMIGVRAESIVIDGRLTLVLLRAGEQLLYKRGQPLGTVECFEFLLGLPAEVNLVGFKSGHDVTKILEDVDAGTMAEILRDGKEPGARYEYWSGYAIDWLPGHYFRITRVDPNTNRIIPGAHRTIYEMADNFGEPLADCFMFWDIDGDIEGMIENDKGRRERTKITSKVLNYNKLSADGVALMCEGFREAAQIAGMRPGRGQFWNGPGKLAAGLLKHHQIMTWDEAREAIPSALWETAEDYLRYGGRIENGWYGRALEAWHHDMRGAHAAAMLELPCLEHGKWERFEGAPDMRDELYCAEVYFSHPVGTVYAGFPWRHYGPGAPLVYPRIGRGWYWSCEIEAAGKLGARVKWHGGWAYRKHCHCRPFNWIKRLHEARLKLDAEEDGRGRPIKTAINGVAGKFGQITGGFYGPWFNPVWSSLISARVRAWMNAAIGAAGSPQEPCPVIGVGTDCLIATRPLGLPQGSSLGMWKVGPLGRSFFWGPGQYWTDNQIKSRGIAKDDALSVYARFEAIFDHWARHCGPVPGPLPRPYPFLKYPTKRFLSPKLAIWEGRPEDGGQWEDAEIAMALSWQERRGNAYAREGDLFMTLAQDRPGGMMTNPYPRPRPPDSEPSRAAIERWQAACEPDFEGAEE